MEQNIPQNIQPATKVAGSRVSIPQKRDKNERIQQNQKEEQKEQQIVEQNDENNENELIKSFGINENNILTTPKKILEKESKHIHMKPLPTREPSHQSVYLNLHQPKQD